MESLWNEHLESYFYLDIKPEHLYIICSGSAVETRDAHSPGSSCVNSLFYFVED